MDDQHAKDLAYGAYLLVGRLRNSGEQIIDLLEAETIDEPSFSLCVDGLVTLSAYLIDRFIEAFDLDQDAAFDLIPDGIQEALGPNYIGEFSELIDRIRSGKFPNTTDLAATGCIAQELSLSLCLILADNDDVHPGAYLKRIRNLAQRNPTAISLGDPVRIAESKSEANDDEHSNAVRESLLMEILETMHKVAQTERIVYELPDPDAVLAMNTLADFTYTIARIGSAIYDLASHNHTYGALALLRQLVEFEYLLWAFHQYPGSINEWALSSRETREQAWTPGAIRSRAGTEFRRIDYTAHCEMGGHPTPDGIVRAYPDTPYAPIHADLASHLHSIWTMLVPLYWDLAEASLLPVDHLDLHSLHTNIEPLFREWMTHDKVRYLTFY
ncbi:Uncharacterised protein [Mycobacteroides abscessus subsp. massiliense]|uniref:hypothetical protein n=1 Tax=Mycobacteroides abscessus TaxID=36809 RepID=UPI0009CDDA15|nr:hypothetical protein [Mycobacteroides abscessus]SKF92888.1 Uncharacterised protein [Mycobacteroides abscessus subsp. massiliense]SKH14075.1 Uncharacterised protein [Mycobacteroides abscessus subsp. massiliense]SKJ39403.1 Uncharacterised protein [Mycobacteroides abscessus subsp. massiliense]SKJ75658.1 Uncharacterised protein [Mycobacteroides abscessus subsp. massiliense]SKL03155.1 Uncharacterised protein [Mycobacteroides abscessus subsp. massiliense]